MPTLEDIYAELAMAPVEERPLIEHKPTRRPIRGYCSSKGVVTVNPIPDTLDTLIHELLHRRYPAWTERTVKRETTKLLRRLTPEAQGTLYAAYQDQRTQHVRAKAVQ